MSDSEVESKLRASAMAWLEHEEAIGHDIFTQPELAQFEFEGRSVPLLDRQRGIRKPAMLDAALSFRTTYTPPGQAPPYEDETGRDGLLRYKYRGIDPDHPENRAMRQAYLRELPLIWFVGVSPGRYLARYPVWLVADEPDQLQFAVALDGAQLLVPVNEILDDARRSYVERLTRQRLHQPLFRARVLEAYERQCAMCRLRHAELLDASHILPDSHPRGLPVVPNGICLCKIHHAAYDRNIVGVRPDLLIEVREDILHETDGPMLRHGLQEMAGARLTVPRVKASQPDKLALEERFEAFRAA
jgi:putative restriction endonuclease